MTPAHALLTDQFLLWVVERPRTYADAMSAWRSSCPRLAIWEDAQAAGLVACADHHVQLTDAGVRRVQVVQACNT